MKFTPGILGADFSGSVGAVTASRNKFGPYLRTKAIPVNPNTTRQQEVRSLFAALVNNWTDDITQVQRDAWSNWAAQTTILGKDGSPINITGQNAYIRFNTVRLQIGGSRVDDGPTTFNNGNPPTGFETTEDNVDGVIDLDLAGTAMGTNLLIAGQASDDGDMAVYLGKPVNASRKFFKGPYQLADVLTVSDNDILETWDTLLTLLTNTIDPAEGQFRSLRMRIAYDDGRLSEKFEALADVERASV